MSVTALPISRKLYELTEWHYDDATGFCWYDGMIVYGKQFSNAHNYLPAYTLDFLIDKIMQSDAIRPQVKIRFQNGQYIATTPDCFRAEGTTPLNAVACLCIELINKGVNL